MRLVIAALWTDDPPQEAADHVADRLRDYPSPATGTGEVVVFEQEVVDATLRATLGSLNLGGIARYGAS